MDPTQSPKSEIFTHILNQDWGSLSSALLNSSDSSLISLTTTQILSSISHSTPLPNDFLQFLSSLVSHYLSLPQHPRQIPDLKLRIQFLDRILNTLTPIISLKDSETGQLRMIKTRPKTLPLISVCKIEEKLKMFEEFNSSYEVLFENTFNQVVKQEQLFGQSAERILEDVSELNERIICLNEEVVSRLDCYLQMQSKMIHYFKKILNEQEAVVKSTESYLTQIQSEFQHNLSILNQKNSENSRPISMYLYLSTFFFLLGFVFSSTLYKFSELIIKPHHYY